MSVNMSAASCLLTEDQFLCSICLDLFTDPVTTPCGHNFCKSCITQHWNINVRCQCPHCKEMFDTRPDMKVNTFVSEMTAQFRQLVEQEAQQGTGCSSSQQHVSKGEVLCDDCSGTKLKALKSCLVCLASYCETHLEPHLTTASMKKHQLIDPVENVEGKICLKHEKLLELFCKTDRMCICLLCTVKDHKGHSVVPLEEEYEAEIRRMILKRRLKVEEIRRLVELSQEDAAKESKEGVRVFSALKKSVEKRQRELVDSIAEKQRKTEQQAEGFIKRLEQEICELKRRISQPEGCFLQSFLSAGAALPSGDLTGVNFRPTRHHGTVARGVKQLEDTLCEHRERLMELRRIRRSAVEVTLDPETAHPQLNLSDDGRKVKHSDTWKNVPDSPKRFDLCLCVLAKQSFSSGRFYYEVWVRGKTEWALGVARESISRKGDLKACPENGYWTICLREENRYRARAGAIVCLSLASQPERVGVWVDYEGRRVSFYDVDTAALIYSFTGCCFAEKLYPYFSPSLKNGGKNSAPLIISPVNPTTT